MVDEHELSEPSASAVGHAAEPLPAHASTEDGPADDHAHPDHEEVVAATSEPIHDDAAEPPVVEEAPPEPEPEPDKKRWYIVKVQSGREESIKNSIERRMRIEGLEEFFGQIYIPTQNVVEMRDGKRRVKKHKLYPGYLMAEVEYNDRILYLFRETSGVGDFVGGGVDKSGVSKPPIPMPDHEIQRMLAPMQQGKEEKAIEIVAKPPVDRGDRVRVKDGAFAGMEGEVKEILEAKGQIRVELTIFGRPVPIELEYWAVDRV